MSEEFPSRKNGYTVECLAPKVMRYLKTFDDTKTMSFWSKVQNYWKSTAAHCLVKNTWRLR